jgi:hypothetical protein
MNISRESWSAISVLILSCVPCLSLAAGPVPPDAQSAIDAVHSAAVERDFPSLKALMIQEFTWSFGGDGSSEQAIASWQSDPEATAALIRATAGRCGRISEQYVQCPEKAGLAYRAGFTHTPSGWQMAYFVAGD